MDPAIIVAIVTSASAVIAAVLAWRSRKADNSQSNYDQLQEDVSRLRQDFESLQIRYWILDDYVVVLRESLVKAGITPPAYPAALVRVRHKEGE